MNWMLASQQTGQHIGQRTNNETENTAKTEKEEKPKTGNTTESKDTKA